MAAKGKPFYACQGMPLPLPPIGCFGAQLRELDLSGIQGVKTYSNGTVETPILRLVGKWDGTALTLTEPPRVAKASDQTQIPISDCTGPDTKQLDELAKRIAEDTHALGASGVQVLEVGPCAGRVRVVVAVADTKAVETLHERYGDIDVVGWLRPA